MRATLQLCKNTYYKDYKRKKTKGAMKAKAPDTSAVTAKNSLCDRHMKAAEKKMAGPTLNTPKAIPATVMASPEFKIAK